MVAADLLALGFIATVSLVCMGLGWLLPRLAPPRGEESDVPEGDGDHYDTDGVSPQMRQARDDLMAVADVVKESFDRAERAIDAAFDRLGPPPGWTPSGLTEADVATLRRNRLHLTDAERYELDMTFVSIVQPGEVPE